MPSLDARLAEWRRTMKDSNAGCEEVLDELECHLRDEVESRVRQGESTERAFHLAVARLGGTAEIAVEFAKIPPPALPWLPIRAVGLLGLALIITMILPLVPRFRSGGSDALMALHMGLVTLGYVATLLVGILAIIFLLTRLFHDLSAGQKESLKRTTLLWSGASFISTGAGIALGGLCPYEKEGWLWGLAPHEIGGIAILAWSLVMFVSYWRHQRTRHAHLAMLLGIGGNIAVILGWFAVASGGVHSIELPSNHFVTLLLVIGQLAAGCTALAPPGCLRSGQA